MDTPRSPIARRTRPCRGSATGLAQLVSSPVLSSTASDSPQSRVIQTTSLSFPWWAPIRPVPYLLEHSNEDPILCCCSGLHRRRELLQRSRPGETKVYDEGRLPNELRLLQRKVCAEQWGRRR